MSEFKGTFGEWIVKHSESKNAWNVIGTQLAGKYKIARFPYLHKELNSEEFNMKEKYESFANAIAASKAPNMISLLTKCLNKFSSTLDYLKESEFENELTEDIVPLMADIEKLIKEATELK